MNFDVDAFENEQDRLAALQAMHARIARNMAAAPARDDGEAQFQRELTETLETTARWLSWAAVAVVAYVAVMFGAAMWVQ